MSTDNAELLQNTYEAFGRGDIPAVMAVLDRAAGSLTPGRPLLDHERVPHVEAAAENSMSGRVSSASVVTDMWVTSG